MGTLGIRGRPYFVEYTGSHPNSEVNRRKARIVLRCENAREVLGVLAAFLLCGVSFLTNSFSDESALYKRVRQTELRADFLRVVFF